MYGIKEFAASGGLVTYAANRRTNSVAFHRTETRYSPARFATRRGPPLQAHRRLARLEFCSHARCRNWDMPAAVGTGEVGSAYRYPPRTRPRLLDQCLDSET